MMHARTLFLMVVVAGMERLADGCCLPPRFMLDTVSGVAFGPNFVARETGTIALSQDLARKAFRRNFVNVVTGVKSTVRYVKEIPENAMEGKTWKIYNEEDCDFLGLTPILAGPCLSSDFVKVSPSIVYGDGTECQTLKADDYLLIGTAKNMTLTLYLTSEENCVPISKTVYASDGSGYMNSYANFRVIINDEDFGDIFDVPANCTDVQSKRELNDEDK